MTVTFCWRRSVSPTTLFHLKPYIKCIAKRTTLKLPSLREGDRVFAVEGVFLLQYRNQKPFGNGTPSPDLCRELPPQGAFDVACVKVLLGFFVCFV